MNDKPYYQINITFLPNDKEDAERIFDKCMDIVCGGDIGLGLHVCKSQDWVGSLRELSDEPRFKVIDFPGDEWVSTYNNEVNDPNYLINPDEEGSYLFDTVTNKIIYSDTNNWECPEDMNLRRDLRFFVDWMNDLA